MREGFTHLKDAPDVTPFTPPTADQLLAIRVNAGIDKLAQTERFAHAEPDLVEAILDEASKFASNVLAPINKAGDVQGCRWDQGVVALFINTTILRRPVGEYVELFLG